MSQTAFSQGNRGSTACGVLETGAGVSFEYFPAKTEVAVAELKDTADRLAVFKPAYQTVTFGAGGTGLSPAHATAQIIESLSTLGVDTASHLAFAGQSLADIHAFTDALAWNGCKHLIALRGDTPEAHGIDPAYNSVATMIADLKARNGFRVGVACYPEVHPKAGSLLADLDVLKAKEDAGADYAITQFFFDNDDFYDFVEAARKAGVTIPLIPGIMPINNFSSLNRFAERCGATVPSHIGDAFENSNWQSPHDIAAGLLRDQISDLVSNGVENVHIYTLNKYDLSAIACEAFYEAYAKHNDGKANSRVA